ncbi:MULTISPECIES: phospholipase D-like domain-containing protein [unclassified Helicobacter]|uniref:phospholipase D-like domain-containing protein n=1 Tax=unclassified Helicobacter TaxID=2593540 RepID=UPI001F24EDEC|nr:MULTISPECIES: phospholipase D-like domain-containing protein [unclassified Helicobacter]
MYFLRLFGFIFFLFVFAYGDGQIFFMPEEQKQALRTLKEALRSAKKEINIAIYSFTNKEIAKVLRDQARNGIRINIIYDRESNIKNSYSTIGYLATLNNISVCLLQGQKAAQKDHYGIMHQKLAIIDDHSIIFGSANWSKSAFENNFEILYLSTEKKIIQKATKHFKEMLKDCKAF